MPHTENDKLQWEVEKLQVEVRNLKSFLVRYLTLATAAVVCITAVSQCQKANTEATKAKLELKNAQEEYATIQKSLEVAKNQLVDAQTAEALAKAEEQNAYSRQAEQERSSAERLSALQRQIADLETKITQRIETTTKALPAGDTKTKDSLENLVQDVREDTSRIQQDASKATADLVHDGSKARLFFFASDDAQKKTVREIKPKLDAHGFFVTNILGYRGRQPLMTEVRYFRHPADQAEAKAILEVLQNECGLKQSRVSYVIDKDSVGEGRKYQIWLKKDAFTHEE